jgi:hypothetical protein
LIIIFSLLPGTASWERRRRWGCRWVMAILRSRVSG